MSDEHWMKRVLRLAEKGRGRTSPNPMVAAVLVKDGRSVGEGYHVRAGEAHAEVVALGKAGKEAAGGTLYVNLEPCTHYGRTPPCAPVVISSGVKRVVIGMEDPNPLVGGKGVAGLRQAGLEVEVGLLEKDCRRLNEAFCKHVTTGEPFVTLKVAATLDGRIATRDGESKWISEETSRRLVYRLRDQVDGVVVGVGTILKDDPELTARVRSGRDPYRIVLDSRLRIPEEAKVLQSSPSRTIIATTAMAPKEKVERVEQRGVQVLVVDPLRGKVDLRRCLSRLGQMGIMSLMVEGGSQVNGAFLDGGFVDKLLLFLSPRLLGDPQGLGIFAGEGVADLKDAIPLEEVRVRKSGKDILVEGYLNPRLRPG